MDLMEFHFDSLTAHLISHLNSKVVSTINVYTLNIFTFHEDYILIFLDLTFANKLSRTLITTKYF